jgi:hypothetical protein
MDMGLTNKIAAHVARHDPHGIIRGLLFATFSFAAMGTVTAVWWNPFFTRMTPIEGWELPSLIAFASLVGVFTAIRQPNCSARKAGLGSVASFLGIACPTCNKILMILFGGQALMRWFDPIRPAFTAVGLVLLLVAIRTEWRKRRLLSPDVADLGNI